MAEVKKSITPMEHYNMSDFLRGQASKDYNDNIYRR